MGAGRLTPAGDVEPGGEGPGPNLGPSWIPSAVHTALRSLSRGGMLAKEGHD